MSSLRGWGCFPVAGKLRHPRVVTISRNRKEKPSQEVAIFRSRKQHLPRPERVSGTELSYLLRWDEFSVPESRASRVRKRFREPERSTFAGGKTFPFRGSFTSCGFREFSFRKTFPDAGGAPPRNGKSLPPAVGAVFRFPEMFTSRGR